MISFSIPFSIWDVVTICHGLTPDRSQVLQAACSLLTHAAGGMVGWEQDSENGKSPEIR